MKAPIDQSLDISVKKKLIEGSALSGIDLQSIHSERNPSKTYTATWSGKTVSIKHLLVENYGCGSGFKLTKNNTKAINFSHVNLASIYGLAQPNDFYGSFLLVGESFPFGTLETFLTKVGEGQETLTWAKSLDMGLQITNGLQYLHSLNFKHDRLFPGSIYLAAYEGYIIPRLGDFAFQEGKLIRGNPFFRWGAPDQNTVYARKDLTVDTYSLGTILWQLVTHKRPFNDIPEEFVREHIQAGGTEEIPEEFPQKFQDLLRRSWLVAPEFKEENPHLAPSRMGLRPDVQTVATELLALKKEAVTGLSESNPVGYEQQMREEIARTSLRYQPFQANKNQDYQATVDLRATSHDNRTFYRKPASQEDLSRIVSQVQLPGREIIAVEEVYNYNLAKQFNYYVEGLEHRSQNPEANLVEWANEDDAFERRKISNFTYALANAYSDPRFPNVTILETFHGTTPQSEEGITRDGFAILKMTNGGLYGHGIYTTPNEEYAVNSYGNSNSLLLCRVAMYSPYPVLTKDNLANQGAYKNHDAHIIPVRKNGMLYRVCPMDEHAYMEVAVFNPAAILPRYIVRFQDLAPAPDHRLPVMTMPSPSSLTSCGLFKAESKLNILEKFKKLATCYKDLENGTAIGGDKMGRLHIVNLKTGARLQTWQAHAGELLDIEVMAHKTTGRMVIFTADQTEMRSWALDDGLYNEFDNELENQLQAPQMNPNYF